MVEKKCLLISPVFSRYQILSSKIIQTFIKKALKNISSDSWTIQNIIENTPYGLYKNNVLQPYHSTPLATMGSWWLGNSAACTNWGFKDWQAITHGAVPSSALWCVPTFLLSKGIVNQTVTILLCIIAFASSLYYLVYNCDLLFVVGNGPVVNTGFASLIAMARTLGIRVVYWKDDVRHLWGFSDNPAMIGSLDAVHGTLYNVGNPFEGDGMLTRIYNYEDSKKQTASTQHCGTSYFEYIIGNALNNPEEKIQLGNVPAGLQNLINLGGMIQAKNQPHLIPPINKLRDSYWIKTFDKTFAASMENSYESLSFTQWRLFCDIAAVIVQNRDLISASDKEWLERYLQLDNLQTNNFENITNFDRNLYQFHNQNNLPFFNSN